MRALVIDDSRAVRKILRGFLEGIGYDVFEAADGADALSVLDQQGTMDVALVDWNMPNMNGYEFVVAVRSNSAHKTMYLMMVTTETEIEKVAAALEAGANEYVMKPFTKDMVVEKLRLLTENPV